MGQIMISSHLLVVITSMFLSFVPNHYSRLTLVSRGILVCLVACLLFGVALCMPFHQHSYTLSYTPVKNDTRTVTIDKRRQQFYTRTDMTKTLRHAHKHVHSRAPSVSVSVQTPTPTMLTNKINNCM